MCCVICYQCSHRTQRTLTCECCRTKLCSMCYSFHSHNQNTGKDWQVSRVRLIQLSDVKPPASRGPDHNAAADNKQELTKPAFKQKEVEKVVNSKNDKRNQNVQQCQPQMSSKSKQKKHSTTSSQARNSMDRKPAYHIHHGQQYNQVTEFPDGQQYQITEFPDVQQHNQVTQLRNGQQQNQVAYFQNERQNQVAQLRNGQQQYQVTALQQNQVTDLRTEQQSQVTDFRTERQHQVTEFPNGQQQYQVVHCRNEQQNQVTEFQNVRQKQVTNVQNKQRQNQATNFRKEQQNPLTDLRSQQQNQVAEFKHRCVKRSIVAKDGKEQVSTSTQQHNRLAGTQQQELQSRNHHDVSSGMKGDNFSEQHFPNNMHHYKFSDSRQDQGLLNEASAMKNCEQINIIAAANEGGLNNPSDVGTVVQRSTALYQNSFDNGTLPQGFPALGQVNNVSHGIQPTRTLLDGQHSEINETRNNIQSDRLENIDMFRSTYNDLTRRSEYDVATDSQMYIKTVKQVYIPGNGYTNIPTAEQTQLFQNPNSSNAWSIIPFGFQQNTLPTDIQPQNVSFVMPPNNYLVCHQAQSIPHGVMPHNVPCSEIPQATASDQSQGVGTRDMLLHVHGAEQSDQIDNIPYYIDEYPNLQNVTFLHHVEIKSTLCEDFTFTLPLKELCVKATILQSVISGHENSQVTVSEQKILVPIFKQNLTTTLSMPSLPVGILPESLLISHQPLAINIFGQGVCFEMNRSIGDKMVQVACVLSVPEQQGTVWIKRQKLRIGPEMLPVIAINQQLLELQIPRQEVVLNEI